MCIDMTYSLIQFFIFCTILLYNQPIQAIQEVESLKLDSTAIEVTDDLGIPNRSAPLTRDALARDVVGTRPDSEGKPTQVKVGMFVFDIFSIDDAEQTFSGKIRYTLRWEDRRLASSKQGIRKIPPFEAWNPLIREANTRDVKKDFLDEVLFVNNKGSVVFAQGLDGTFTVPLNLRDFPLDSHKLYIRLESFYGPEDLQLLIDEKLTGWNSTLSIPDWIVTDGQVNIGKKFRSDQERELAEFVFSFNIKRHIGYYLWKVIVPLSLIIMMSWSVFYIDPNRLEASVGLSATSILTLFAFQFTISTHLPKIAYLTRMDKFTMSCSVLILLALFEGIMTSYLAKINKTETALKVDYFSRIAFPVTYILICIFAFLL
jgi:Neurotransmitter-gated ion-channel ligand binding domain/Neurotransmitter-gated ion-channel transmembrane region